MPCIRQKGKNMNFWTWWYLQTNSVDMFDRTSFLNHYYFTYLLLSKAKENTISFNIKRNLNSFIKKTASSTTLERKWLYYRLVEILPDVFGQMQICWLVAKKCNILADYWTVISQAKEFVCRSLANWWTHSESPSSTIQKWIIIFF